MQAKELSDETLNQIFQLDSENPDVIRAYENDVLEFKKSFTPRAKSKYSKTCAAFANTKGGYIIFGIDDETRELVGLTGDSFDKLNPAVISQSLNSNFAPNISFDLRVFHFQGKKFGILYVFEAAEKPVISIKNDGEDVKEGEIYYRYGGRSEKIHYPELRAILDVQKRTQVEKFMSHLTRINKIGVDNVGILDTITGEVTGPNLKKFVIDESLLNELKFIQDGEFNERGGEPTLKLVGDVETVHTSTIEIPTAIIERDLFRVFLDQAKVSKPMEYIDWLCNTTFRVTLIFYFIHQAGLSLLEVKNYIEKTQGYEKTKQKLLKRLASTDDPLIPLKDTGTPAALKKRVFRDQFLSKTIKLPSTSEDLFYALIAIQSLSSSEMDLEYICSHLKTWFANFYNLKPHIKSQFRKAVCYLDTIFYRNES
jgi:hypothetical protein